MPDITMCLNNCCELSDQCYRFVAEPSEYQSYSSFVPTLGRDGKWSCDHFWPVSGTMQEDDHV
jgi:hypothetical protein